MRQSKAFVWLASALLTLSLLAIEPQPAAAQADIDLGIPDTGQEAGVPAGGWCGEAAIQMACLHYGAYIPQRLINRAGKPQHPDLYAEELGRALDGVGFSYEHWKPRAAGESNVAGFIGWIRTNLAAGRPVIVGAKVNPTQHPEWVCDHFMLAVGAKAHSLIFNTTWKRREELTREQLAGTDKGLGFENSYRHYFGLVVTGKKAGRANERPVSIRLDPAASGGGAKCTVLVRDLEKGRQYVLVREGGPAAHADAAPHGADRETFTASSNTREIPTALPAAEPSVFYCVPASGSAP
ncbi:MAG: hypothetical protein ABSE73_31615 [Planctomycetota bacterium]